MKRLTLAALAAGALSFAATPAQAQFRVYFGHPGDTAVGVRPGVAHVVPVRVLSFSYAVEMARITFVYDPAKIEIEGLDATCCNSLYAGVDTTRPGPGQFSARANGYAYGGNPVVFQLRVRLAPGVADGTYLWMRVDSLRFYSIGEYRDYSYGSLGQFCHATSVHGDVDGTNAVTSRDALIALSAAVGLPTGGYDLTLGDVDGDGLTNSRDALMMLHHVIGLAYPYSAPLNRTGSGVPDACPGLTPPGEAVALRISGAAAGNDTIGVLNAAATSPVALGSTGGGYRQFPRLAGDGVRILYNCIDNYYGYRHVCQVNYDGSGLDTLLAGFSSYDQPDWNPAGTRFLVRDGGSYPTRYDTGGVNRVQLTNFYGNYYASVIWSRDGATITHVAYNGVHTINPDSSGDSLRTGGGINDGRTMRLAVGGDSLVMSRGSFQGLWLLTGGVLGRWHSFPMMNPAGDELGFDLGPDGLIFAQHEAGVEGLWLLPSPTAPVVRLTRGRHMQPSFRRNP